MNTPLEFFQRNIVVIHGLNPVESNYQATTEFSLLESDAIFGSYTQGTRKSSILKKTKTAEVYIVAPYNNDPATLITVYWCGYKDDSVKFQMLGNQSTRHVDHRMDGCTFGVGSATATGHVLVGHFNIQTVSGRADVGAMRDSAKVMLGNNAKNSGEDQVHERQQPEHHDDVRGQEQQPLEVLPPALPAGRTDLQAR